MKRNIKTDYHKRVFDIAVFLKQDYKPYNAYEISNKTKIHYTTTRHCLNTLVKIGVVKKEKKEYIWNSIPKSFFDSFKEKKEQYINLLEDRLLELRWKK